MANENTILVVDDEPLVFYGTAGILKNGGYSVLEAGSGEKAIQLAKKHLPDLILLDVVMPDIDGIEVCKRLKSNRYTSTGRP